mgnify:CR=1 FL=1
MTTNNLSRNVLALALLASSFAMPAKAQEEDKALTLSGSATLVSDYRWRGYSLSNKGWAIQGSLQLDHKSGLFIGTWASSIAPVGQSQVCISPLETGGDTTLCSLVGGSTVEVDFFGGWSGTIGPIDVTGGLLAYLYPGADGLNYFEFYGTAGYTIGTLALTAGLNWAPNQGNLSSSNRYLFGSAAFTIPDTPITIKGTIGQERGSVVVDLTGQTTSKFDWLIGVDIAGSVVGLDPLTIGFAYSGNNLPDRDGFNSYATSGFIFSIGASF